MDRGTKRRRDVDDDGLHGRPKHARHETTTVRQLQAEIGCLQGEISRLQQMCAVYRAHILRAYAFIHESHVGVAIAAPTMSVC